MEEQQQIKLLSKLQLFQYAIRTYRDIKFLFNETRSIKDTFQKMTSIPIENREDLINGVQKKTIHYGDFVKIDGILLEYAHLYRPITYVTSLPKSPKPTIKNGKLVYAMNFEPFQLPVSKVPKMKLTNGNEKFRLAFLYPTDFKSFIYTGENTLTYSSDLGGKSKPNFTIPNSAKAIPLIISDEDAINYSQQRVEVVGRVSKLDENVTAHLAANDFSSMAFSGIVQPLNQNTPSICLDITKNKSSVSYSRGSRGSLNSYLGSIFFECHIEGFESVKNSTDFYNLCLECYPGEHFGSTVRLDDTFPIATSGDIKFTGRYPNYISFYKECNLADPLFSNEVRKMGKTVYGFEKNLKKISPELSLHIDFMYDYSVKNMLRTEVLNSNLANQIDDETIKETINWLKGNEI
ncbi:hypothetical protein [Alkalihalobacterium alkalinitrilicum]|uniref:hypothetical protein n=1 Tax=Alkalihalobacterium alkalinitrilicum TaxID=427920 RepID=UPI000995B680|nr:hypothetical protein [Alkalihalobacterium alkalinitrilicum]